jgi:hypothetical protein
MTKALLGSVLNLSLEYRLMSAENHVLKSIRSEFHYRGTYTDNAFGLLAAPVPLYRSLLKHLRLFGATLQNFRLETQNLADSHIVVVLPDLNTTIRIRLDRFELDCWKLQEIGTETAHRIALATWAAVREADDSMQLSGHMVDLNIFAEIQGRTYRDLMAQYVKTPEELGVMDLGVAFYTPPVQKNEPWINIVLDRVFRQDDQVWIKISIGSDAATVTLSDLALNVENKTIGALGNLGLHFAKEGNQ